MQTAHTPGLSSLGRALHSVCLQTCLSAIELGALFSCLNIETHREDSPAPGWPRDSGTWWGRGGMRTTVQERIEPVGKEALAGTGGRGGGGMETSASGASV